MINDPLKLLGMFLRDLLEIEEIYISIGRKNKYKDDFNELTIIIDSLSSMQRLTNSLGYKNGIMNYSQQWRIPCTIDFYGDTAWYLCNKFSLLIYSQQAYDLKEKYKFAVLSVSNMINLTTLTGSQYSNRYQLELNLLYTSSYENDILNITEAKVEPLLVSK